MSTIAPQLPDREGLIGVLVSRTRKKNALSPFFAKADGLLIVDPITHAIEFQKNDERTSGSICALILASGAKRLVCGFIAKPERDRLSELGIDIRLGSCASRVESLVRQFATLPTA